MLVSSVLSLERRDSPTDTGERRDSPTDTGQLNHDVSPSQACNIRDTEIYETTLRRVLARHSSEPVDLMSVNSLRGWCEARSGTVPASDPVAMAVRDQDTGHVGILICRELDSSRIDGVRDRMSFGGLIQSLATLPHPNCSWSTRSFTSWRTCAMTGVRSARTSAMNGPREDGLAVAGGLTDAATESRLSSSALCALTT